jgi:outer membrane protein assembly factor BamB
MPSADGPVTAFASSGSILYLGGSFTQFGERTGQFDIVGERTPRVLGGGVGAIASDGRGGWFLAGEFISVGGVRCPRLARIGVDGTLDRRWCVAPNSTVIELTVIGSRLYVGGEFGSIAGEKRPAVAAFDIASAKLLPWRPPPFETVGCGSGEENVPGGASIWAIAASRSAVYVYGCIEGGTTGGDLEVFDSVTGKQKKWELNVPEKEDWTPVVGSWALAPSGETLYVEVESFKWPEEGSWPDVVRTRLAAVDARTGKLERWYPAPNGGFQIAPSGSTIYLAGKFSRVGGEPRRNLAAVDARTGSVTGWHPDVDSEIGVIVPAGKRVFVAGTVLSSLTRVGGARRDGVAAIDTRTGKATSWSYGVGGSSVNTIAVSGEGRVALGLVGSGLVGSAVSGPTRRGLAAIDTSTGRVTSWNPPALGFTIPLGLFNSVDALAVSGSTLYLAGNFARLGAHKRQGLAAVDLRTGDLKPWNPRTAGDWKALTISERVVYAARRSQLAAIDAQTGDVLWSRRLSIEVILDLSALVVGRTVFVGGETFGAFDAATGKPKAFPAHIDESVNALAASGDTLFVAELAGGLVALDAKTGETRWRAKDINAGVTAMAVSGNVLYIGGHFDTVAGQARKRLAALDVATGELKSWKVGIDAAAPNYEITAILVVGSTLYVGENFFGGFNGYFAAYPLAES